MAAKDSKHGSLRAQAARKVRAARGWANLSQPELAAQLGEDVMSLASLRRIEQGKRDVTAAELLHIGEVCDVPRKFMLYGWSESKSTAQSQADALDGIIADMARRIERHERLHKLVNERLAALDDGDEPDLIGQLEGELGKRARR